jgi:flagellar protein FliT
VRVARPAPVRSLALDRPAGGRGRGGALIACKVTTMNPSLLNYYEAIERASADMLSAARDGNWDLVVKLEGACGLLISQLKQAARGETLQPQDAQTRTRIMQRILLRDAEIRHLAEPWLEQIDLLMAGKNRTLH